MGSGAMTYIPSFINTVSGIQNMMGGGTYRDTHTHTHTHTDNKVVL
jgi:hypothetical protein